MQLEPRRPCPCIGLLSYNVCGIPSRNVADLMDAHTVLCTESAIAAYPWVMLSRPAGMPARPLTICTAQGIVICLLSDTRQCLSEARMLQVCVPWPSSTLAKVVDQGGYGCYEIMAETTSVPGLARGRLRQPRRFASDCRGSLTSSGVFVMLPSAARMASFFDGGDTGVGAVDLICMCRDVLSGPGREPSTPSRGGLSMRWSHYL